MYAFEVAARELKGMKSSFEDHKVRTCLSPDFILEAADFSKNFQAFLKNYGKENNTFECAFTL